LTVRGILDRVLSPAGSGAGRRNWVILFDTGTTSLTSVVLLLGAARQLAPESLSTFAVAQLIIVTAVGILRAGVFGPAMAAQRTTGRASIPLRWSVTIAQPASLLATAVVVFLVPRPEGWLWLPSVALAGAVYLAQDALRNVLVSRNALKPILIADVVTCLLVLGSVTIYGVPGSPPALMLFWCAAGTPGLAYAIVATRRHTAQDAPVQSLAETWRLGRWGAVDAGLAAVATLVPMIVSTTFLSMTASGSYRVLQSALGPLNILHSTLLTIMLVDSWQTTTLKGLESLRRKVFKILLCMVGGTVLYLAAALPAMVALSGLRGPDVTRVAIIVALAGLLGSANTPFNGAALSLGRQHWGAGIRLATVALALTVSVGSNSWVPWQDPIGVSMLGGAAVALAGWTTAYAVANRREDVRVREHSTAQKTAKRRAARRRAT